MMSIFKSVAAAVGAVGVTCVITGILVVSIFGGSAEPKNDFQRSVIETFSPVNYDVTFGEETMTVRFKHRIPEGFKDPSYEFTQVSAETKVVLYNKDLDVEVLNYRGEPVSKDKV